MKVFTIGAYGNTEEQFFKKLTDNSVDTFCDLRQRRGVRGSEYAFVNSYALQAKLHELDIKYAHIKELAPTTDIREKQWADDAKKGVQKRTRTVLGAVFKAEYEKLILGNFDIDRLVEQLDDAGACNVALFCVEREAAACHRSLVAAELEKKYGYEVINL